MFEKRVNGRSPIELAASYGIGEDPRPDREAKINNISSGGFCLTLSNKMAIGEKIELAIDLDTKDDVIVYAKVVWVKKNERDQKYTIGVQIIEKEGSDYERFLEFYNQQL
jgi:hypothetical protein